MRGMRLEVNIKRILTAILAGLLCLLFSLPVSASEAECRTGCKEGPKEYKKWAKWQCEYYEQRTAGSFDFRSSGEKNTSSSECTLRIEGRFRNVDNSPVGRYKDFDECFHDFCIPKITAICGIEDRCTEPKYWIKDRARRLQ